MDIDDFNESIENQLFRLSGPGSAQASPRITQDSSIGGVMGGERDFMVLVQVPAGEMPLPNAAMGAIGRPQVGLLEVATSGVRGSQVMLQYDGVDTLPGQTPGDPIVDVLRLGGLDLTDGGNSDRFRLNIHSAQAQNGVALEVLVRVVGANDDEIALNGVFAAESQTPFAFDIPFSAFSFDGGASMDTFRNARSVTFLFNPNFVPNADFEIDSIVTVPEPSSLALLGLAGISAIVFHRRRRTA